MSTVMMFLKARCRYYTACTVAADLKANQIQFKVVTENKNWDKSTLSFLIFLLNSRADTNSITYSWR